MSKPTVDPPATAQFPTGSTTLDPAVAGAARWRWSERHQRPACTVTTDDCEGYASYLVYLTGSCGGFDCAGHAACEEHAQAFRRRERPARARRITSIPKARLRG